MSKPVPALLPTGAYIIRNRQTSTVLHTQSADATNRDGLGVQAYQQDEGQFKDQQIWWVEPLANSTSDSAFYSITSPGSGKALEANPESRLVFSNQHCGGPWQRWRLRQTRDTKTGGIWYTIINMINEKVLDVDSTNSQSNVCVNMQSDSPGLAHRQWEFAIPVVGFPPGWFHIQAVGTGNLLSHDYSHNSPSLVPAPSSLRAPEHRSSWQYQWTLCHSKCFKSPTTAERTTWPRMGTPVEPNSWRIINRLTRSPLSHYPGRMNATNFATREDNLAWKLELDAARNWILTNRATECLLTEDAPGSFCYTNRVLAPVHGRQSWILKLLAPSDDHSAFRCGPAASRGDTVPMLPPHRNITARKHGSRVPVCTNRTVTTVRLSLLLKSTLRLMRGRLRA